MYQLHAGLSMCVLPVLITGVRVTSGVCVTSLSNGVCVTSLSTGVCVTSLSTGG